MTSPPEGQRSRVSVSCRQWQQKSAPGRARTLLPAGMLLWKWDADPEFEEAAGEKWLGLLPKKWNKQQLYRGDAVAA